jgi:hypothetical protein
MIPYDKITKREISPAEMPAGTTAVQAAEAIQLTEIINLLIRRQHASSFLILTAIRYILFVKRTYRPDYQRMRRSVAILTPLQTGRMP